VSQQAFAIRRLCPKCRLTAVDIDCLVDRLRKRPIEAGEVGAAQSALVTLRQRMSRARRNRETVFGQRVGLVHRHDPGPAEDFERGVKRPPEPPEPEPPRKRTCLAGQFRIRGKCPGTGFCPFGNDKPLRRRLK
jgi:hypothetical protein